MFLYNRTLPGFPTLVTCWLVVQKVVAKKFPINSDLAACAESNMQCAHAEAFSLAYMLNISQVQAGEEPEGPSIDLPLHDDNNMPKERCHTVRFCGLDVLLTQGTSDMSPDEACQRLLTKLPEAAEADHDRRRMARVCASSIADTLCSFPLLKLTRQA